MIENIFSPIWESVRKETLQFYKAEPENVTWSLPGLNLEITNGLKMVDYIYELEERSLFKNGKDEGDVDLQIQFLVLINFLCNFVVTFEGILNQQYDEIIRSLKIINSDITPALEKTRSTRWSEIKHFKFWRHKVFAHMSYAHPSKVPTDLPIALCGECERKLDEVRRNYTDNTATRLTSVILGLGTSIGIGSKDFCLPGGGIAGSEKFPHIDIHDNKKVLLNHYVAWSKMYLKPLQDFKEQIHKIKSSEIIKIMQNGKQIYSKL